MFAGSDELHFSSSEEDENELNLTKVITFFYFELWLKYFNYKLW